MKQISSFGSEDASNPFLDDIRAASAAASVLSYGGNPFEETPSIETSSVPDPSPSEASSVAATADSDAAQTPTEDMIDKLIEDYQLYQDPYLKAVITECHARTPLHVCCR
ncbi:hypothetical protein OS493_009422 [Desmophyllum pertusum]|uniref:Uncharacterized protein n=1 Tax=Desmophyllum pertusum TaxID=174260 RepID=A0A9W9Z319_9CNID|nr:hypothetical protein OS493_009422 [Desmophyllum pertusum]